MPFADLSDTHFADRLVAAILRKGTPALVGLDPRAASLPAGMISYDHPTAIAAAYKQFCCEVIDVIAPLAAVVKPQAAFFEQLGPAGCTALAEVIAYASSKQLLVIIDGKRNDIGTTAAAYADAYLGAGTQSPWGGDALTVSPYLGDDSITPFLSTAQTRGAGIFVLVKTSNPGGGRFQDLVCDGIPLYRHVARFVEELADQSKGATGYGSVGAVAGATYPDQLAELRFAMPHTWLLIPGYGAQGGTAADCAAAFDDAGLGAIVNSSRGITFAYERSQYSHLAGPNWQKAVELATRDMIAEFRAQTSAGRLPQPTV